MVKIDRTPTPPTSLALEKAKAHGSYCLPDVVRQLQRDFHRKCYLCELIPSDYQVEHLLPHHGGTDRDRMFDWNNLFLSCPHCNGVKNRGKYEGNVVDCCRTDPESVLSHRITDCGHVAVTPLADTDEAKVTAQLLTDCYELRSSGIREAACDYRVKELKKTMDLLYQTLGKLNQAEEPGKSRHLRVLRGMTDRSHPFAGFTRTYVRQYMKTNPKLCGLLSL